LRLLGVSAAGWAAWSWSFGRVAWTVAAAALAYHALCIARWGRTAGKWLTGLRVEMPAGGPVGPARALWRGVWAAAVYLPWVVAPALLVGGWLTVVAGDRRSPADRAAGTRVVLA
ncbi:MAG TPA: RDD family protein, partial [Acidimicrobiales bacterium]|nr:RDD family protein [Acidimicrobiales bacterium]